MASVLDQLNISGLSLQGNGLNPLQNNPAWGYQNAGNGVPPDLNPADSDLHLLYSIYTSPNVRLVDFNKGAGVVPGESRLDELDPIAPENTQAGAIGSVTSQIYKSALGRTYAYLGPQPGRY